MICNFFGLPGSGKTTLAAKMAITEQRKIDMGISRYKYVYTNANINYPGLRIIKWEYIGLYDYTDCMIIIDEIGLYAHNRRHKEFPHRIVEWFCTHRHDRCDLFYFGQYYNQADKTIRDVTEKLYYMRRSIIPGITTYTLIPKTIVIPKETGDITEGYRMPGIIERIFKKKYFRRSPWYKYFNSWESPFKRPPAVFTLVPGSPRKIDSLIASVVIPCRESLLDLREKIQSFLRK